MSTLFDKDYLKSTGLDICPNITNQIEDNELKRSKNPLSSSQVENINGLESQSSFSKPLQTFVPKQTKVIKMEEQSFTSDQTKVTGWEIQPYMPKENEIIAQEIMERLQNEGGPCLLRVIKETLKEAKLQAKQVAPVLSKPKVLDGDLVMVPVVYGMVRWGSNAKAKMMNKCAQPLIRKQKLKATSVGEFDFFFNFPKLYDVYIADFEKLSKFQVEKQLAQENKKLPQLLFSEKLASWTLERRQRVDGRYDVYYHHKKSFSTFRSTVEVSNFILYNSYPGNPSLAKKRKLNRSLSQGYSTRGKTPPDVNNKSSSFVGGKKLEDTWVEEDTLRFHGHMFKDLHNSHVNITTDYDSSNDSEATESDEEIKSMIKQHNELFKSLSKKAKQEKKGKEKRTSQSRTEVESNQASFVIPMSVKEEEHNNSVVEVPVVKNVDNMAEDLSKTTAEKIPLVEEAPKEEKHVALIPNPTPSNQVQSSTRQAVTKQMWDNAIPMPNPDYANDCLSDDIYDQLGDLDSTPSVHLAVHVLSNQFNLGDEEKEEDSIWK